MRRAAEGCEGWLRRVVEAWRPEVGIVDDCPPPPSLHSLLVFL